MRGGAKHSPNGPFAAAQADVEDTNGIVPRAVPGDGGEDGGVQTYAAGIEVSRAATGHQAPASGSGTLASNLVSSTTKAERSAVISSAASVASSPRATTASFPETRCYDGRFDPPSDALRIRAATGAVATLTAQAIKFVTQFSAVVVLARLLLPDDFGLFAMAMPIIGFILLAADLGLADATIQRPQITHEQVSTLFWVSATAGLLLALALVVLAPLAGSFYGDPRVSEIITAMSLTALLAGLSAQHRAILNRRMNFGRLAGLDIAASVGGLAAAVSVALLWQNYWALVASMLMTSAITLLGAWVASGWLPGRPYFERELRSMLGFGGGVTGFNAFNFIARNLDNVLIGRVWGGEALGLYDRAYKLLLFPLQQVNNPLARVMLPSLARLQADPVRYRQAYLRSLRLIILATQPAIACMIVTADWLIPALLGEQWRAAVPIFEWLGLAALMQPFNSTLGWLFISQGRTTEFMRWGGISAGTCAIAFAAGLPWGAVGVAAAYALSEYLVRLPLLWWLVTRRGAISLADLIVTGGQFALAALGGGLAVLSFRWLANPHPLAGLVVALPLAYAAAAALLALTTQGRDTIRDALCLPTDVLRGSRTPTSPEGHATATGRAR